ncbi:DUF4241 domain-containing protein [Hymenobacter rubripertinctus]|uniref:DUF4241 domain-containing protein n=1 Tax=Hymenobacter rubripertinctus TaxID=2029981 RepID=A0A418QPP5_9BACT|nr:DUF4241 domain-containing protein [Hymenobacter rubripertinctus]RIY07081.1 DUF4241 domain-containing protein [Hymenobacter rubripertinctus]
MATPLMEDALFFLDAASLAPLHRLLVDKAGADSLLVAGFRLTTAAPENGLLYACQGDTIAAFTTGFGDGSYATYVGLDAHNQPCRLLTDFQVVAWH